MDIELIRTKEQKLWQRVDTTDADACWEWPGARSAKGYGMFCIAKGRMVKAHRAAWALVNGEIPDGMFICHHCDNPACINPSHLFLGTAKDNTQDAIKKGRYYVRHGREVRSAKLDEETVRHIRATFVPYSHQFGIAALASRYGLNKCNMSRIVHRKTWKHV